MQSNSSEILDRVVMVDRGNHVPLHSQLRLSLQSLIESQFEDGEKFFTERELVRKLGVSAVTVRRALSDLAAGGCLERRVARGSFVRKPSTQPTRLTTVGIFLPEWNSDFLMGFLEQITLQCRSRELGMQLYHIHRGEKLAAVYQQVQRAPQEEAFVLLCNPPEATLELHRALTQRGCRTVNVDTVAPGFTGTFVGVDNAAGMRLGLEHLSGLGHRRIALMVDEPSVFESVRERVRAFEAGCREMGLADGTVFDCGTQPWEDAFAAAYRTMERIWEQSPRPTAVFAVSDDGAWAALKWLAEQGVSVPGEVSVLGFDDDRASRYMHPALSTIAQPVAAMAERAVRLLADGSALGPKAEVFKPTLVVRESTGPAAGGAEGRE